MWNKHSILSHLVAVGLTLFVLLLLGHLREPGSDHVAPTGRLDSGHEIRSGAVAPLGEHSDQVNKQSNGPRPSDSEPRKTGVVKVNDDGSLLVPAEFADRVYWAPITSELKVNPVEMAVMGFDKQHCDKLQELIDRTKMDAIFRESLNYHILSEDDGGVMIRIPANPEGRQSEIDGYKKKLEEVAKGKSEMLYNAAASTLQRITADFGSDEKIVRLNDDGTGEYVYEVIDVSPEVFKELANSEDRLGAYRKAAFRTSKFKSKSVPDRLKHLFK